MPKLIIKKGDFVVNKISIPEDLLAFTIGSEQGNDIVIADDSISYYHVQFEKQSDEYYIRDLQSQNGTFVNHNKISARTILNNEDEIKIGNHVITIIYSKSRHESTPLLESYEAEKVPLAPNFKDKIAGVPSLSQLNSWLNESPEEHDIFIEKNNGNGKQDSFAALENNTREAESFFEDDDEPGPLTTLINTGVDTFKDPPLHVETDALLQPEKTDDKNLHFSDTVPADGGALSEQDATFRHYLIGIYGYYLGKRFKLKRPRTRVGREKRRNHIVLNRNSKRRKEHGVSRRHVTISCKNKKYYLQDRQSKCGTWLNQKKVKPGNKEPLAVGDEIEIGTDKGSHIFRFVVEGNWDFSSPKKAGIWHIRFRRIINAVLTSILAFLTISLFIRFFDATSLFQDMGRLTAKEFLWANASINPEVLAETTLNYGTHPAMADLNGDDFLDVVFIDEGGKTICISGDAQKPLWVNHDFTANLNSVITLQDMNNDLLPDVILLSQDLRVYLLDGRNGREMLKSQVLEGPLTGAPVAGDLNGDGFQDFAIASENGTIYVGFCGSKSTTLSVIESEEFTHAFLSSADMTGDGIADLLVGTETGKVLIVDCTIPKILGEINVSEELSKASGILNTQANIRFPVALGEFNGDRTNDLTISTEQGNVLALSGSTLERLWWDQPESGPDNMDSITPTVSVADFDGDKLADVVVMTRTGKIRVIIGKNSNRDQKSVLWESAATQTEDLIGPPALDDFNNDAIADIVVGDRNGGIHVFDGTTGEILWQRVAQNSKIISPPLVGDLDNDNFLDILIRRSDGNFYRIASNAGVTENALLWGQLFGNSRHTSAFSVGHSNQSLYGFLMITCLLSVLGAIGLNLAPWLKRKNLSKTID